MNGDPRRFSFGNKEGLPDNSLLYGNFKEKVKGRKKPPIHYYYHAYKEKRRVVYGHDVNRDFSAPAEYDIQMSLLTLPGSRIITVFLTPAGYNIPMNFTALSKYEAKMILIAHNVQIFLLAPDKYDAPAAFSALLLY